MAVGSCALDIQRQVERETRLPCTEAKVLVNLGVFGRASGNFGGSASGLQWNFPLPALQFTNKLPHS